MILRKIMAFILLGVTAGSISYLFWKQEVKFLLPTPVPENYQAAAVESRLVLPASLAAQNGKPLFLHFFNPDCPCSRFNVKHFNSLLRTYGERVSFVVVIPPFASAEEARLLIEGSIPVIVDEEDRIATTCGVYSTPQAVLMDTLGKLYFRGNYNKARYCTLKESNYAQMALNDLLEGKAPQNFGLFSSRAYGCEFSSETSLNPLLLQF